jgi:hypothetical protein
VVVGVSHRQDTAPVQRRREKTPQAAEVPGGPLASLAVFSFFACGIAAVRNNAGSHSAFLGGRCGQGRRGV